MKEKEIKLRAKESAETHGYGLGCTTISRTECYEAGYITGAMEETKVLVEENKTAKKIIREFMRISTASVEEFEPEFTELIGQADKLLKECEK